MAICFGTWCPFNDFYLLRPLHNKMAAVFVLIGLAIWLWHIDRDMKARGKPGLFNMKDMF